MTQAQANRHAKWLAAQWIESRLDGTGPLASGVDQRTIAADSKDELRVTLALRGLARRLDRAGWDDGVTQIELTPEAPDAD